MPSRVAGGRENTRRHRQLQVIDRIGIKFFLNEKHQKSQKIRRAEGKEWREVRVEYKT